VDLNARPVAPWCATQSHCACSSPGWGSPPTLVGGRLLWPFAAETRTLLPPGDALNTLTPILAISSATFFLLAAAALLRWSMPVQ
jgi:hypothetical protein